MTHPHELADHIEKALRHAEVRFQCLSDHFKEVGEEALWAMSEVDAERMGKALAATPAVGGELADAIDSANLVTLHHWNAMKGWNDETELTDKDQTLLAAALRAQPASLLRGREPETLGGQINAIYGNLDAEDCAWIDREWMKLRGIIAAPPEQHAANKVLTEIEEHARFVRSLDGESKT